MSEDNACGAKANAPHDAEQPNSVAAKNRIPAVRRWRLSVLEDALGVIAMVGIMLMMVLTTTDVTSRYFFNAPVKGTMEILEIVMGLIVFLALPATQRRNVHIAVDFVINRLKGPPHHILAVLDLLLPLFIFGIITVFGWRIAWDAYKGGLGSSGSLNFPLAPFLFTVPLGGGLLCARFIIQLRHEIASIKGRGKSVS
ncbi:MAG: TRAP transporter small permease [Chloroflexi bacterium]|nr:TRAP transporter small permease [Chloroflexota bacterium]